MTLTATPHGSATDAMYQHASLAISAVEPRQDLGRKTLFRDVYPT